jgi:putative salt-induced outer membrane protein YdiY
MAPKFALSAALILLPYSVLAAESADTIDTAPKLKASAELGALYKTGNTRSGDIKAGLDLNYDLGLWRNALQFDLLVRKTEDTVDGETVFQTSDQKWTINGQSNYTIDSKSKNYVYGNVFYEDSRFGNFATQSSISTGWGRRWLDTKEATFDAEVGPGFKRDVTHATSSVDSMTNTSLIVQAQALYNRHLNEHVDFKQIITAKISPKSGENSKYKSETSITTKLIETLQLKFSIVIDYNTDVADDRKKTDTQTAVTLVYNF